ncbi:MAG TPA: hypothetical protein VD865_13130 [Stenotrophomonas sp.]|nr:hypothetical protein [Stenotrophomonas sp.]
MSTTNRTGIGAKVRAVFASTTTELTMADICTTVGAIEKKDRMRAAWATRDLVKAGYVSQRGERLHSRYRATGKKQPERSRRTPEELREMTRQASQRYRARNPERVRALERQRRKARAPTRRPAAQQPRLARVGLAAANTPAKARPAPPRAETVAEFLARGGRVERLQTAWEAA